MSIALASTTRNVPRWRVTRRDINLLLSITLPWLLMLSFVSGWAASLMGATEFGLHKYSSIAVFVVALAHLAMHWRSLAAYLRRLTSSGHHQRAASHEQGLARDVLAQVARQI